MVAPALFSHSVSEEAFAQNPSSPPEKSHLVFEHDVDDIKSKDVQDKFRLQYLMKLSQEKVWVPPAQRPPKHQCLIIFDWDDTLMYTSFLLHPSSGSPHTANPTTRRLLKAIEKAACTLLEKAISLGNTFIVTNAQKGWVEQCVDCYMPSVRPYLAKVPVISARTAYEPEYPDVKEWKNRAFLELAKMLDPEVITNVISVGDANYEMEAALLLAQHFPNSFIKTIKLKEQPSPEELMKELDLLAPKFETMITRAHNMKIKLERRRVDAPN